MTSNINNYNPDDIIFLTNIIGIIYKSFALQSIDKKTDYILASILVDLWSQTQGFEIYEIGAKMILDCYPDAVVTLKDILSENLRIIMTSRVLFKSGFHFHFLPDYELGFANFNDAEAIVTNLQQLDHSFGQKIIEYIFRTSKEQIILDIADAKRNLYGDILTEGCINVKDVYKYILDNKK